MGLPELLIECGCQFDHPLLKGNAAGREAGILRQTSGGPQLEFELHTLLLARWLIDLEQCPGFIWRRDTYLKVVLIKIRLTDRLKAFFAKDIGVLGGQACLAAGRGLIAR